MAAALEAEPEFARLAWYWFLPLGAIACGFVVVGIGAPAIACLLFHRRSRIAYVFAVSLAGAAICGAIGAANDVPWPAVVLGALLYAATAVVIDRASRYEN